MLGPCSPQSITQNLVSCRPAPHLPFGDVAAFQRRRKGHLAVEAITCDAGPDNLGCVLTEPERRKHVLDAIKWAWQGYKNCSWGKDDLKPVSCTSREWIGLGATLVDSLDTLILAGMDQVRNGYLAAARQRLLFVCWLYFTGHRVRHCN